MKNDGEIVVVLSVDLHNFSNEGEMLAGYPYSLTTFSGGFSQDGNVCGL